MPTKSIALIAVFFALLFVWGCGGDSNNNSVDNREAFRTVAIPVRDNAYSRFNSQVIGSREQLDQLLSSVPESEWRGKELFVRVIQESDLDFDRDALILLRNTEGSGSVGVSLDTPRVKSRRLLSTIQRRVPPLGTADMAYYAFALAVSKYQVDEVVIEVENRETIRLSVPD